MENETQKVFRYALTNRPSDAVDEGKSLYDIVNDEHVQSMLGFEPGNISSSVYYINGGGSISRLRNKDNRTGFSGAEFPKIKLGGKRKELGAVVDYFQRSFEKHKEELPGTPIAIVYEGMEEQFKMLVKALEMKPEIILHQQPVYI